jgi:DNA-binding NarL/FixJ family response regulator
MAAPQVLSVLLVDDHELIRQGLARAFERTTDFTVVGEAGSVGQGMRLAEQLRPDVVVSDVRLPDGTGFDLVRHLRKERPELGIVVLTMYAGDEQLFGALEAGASAFVAKDSPSDDVIAAARHASVSPRSFAAADLAGAMQRKLAPSGPQLSTRESEVLRLLAEGLGVAAIARQLFVSESTAKTHISKIYDKLGAANRAQAIMIAMRSGLLGGDDHH